MKLEECKRMGAGGWTAWIGGRQWTMAGSGDWRLARGNCTSPKRALAPADAGGWPENLNGQAPPPWQTSEAPQFRDFATTRLCLVHLLFIPLAPWGAYLLSLGNSSVPPHTLSLRSFEKCFIRRKPRSIEPTSSVPSSAVRWFKTSIPSTVSPY
jgi:hypothetical protein